MSARWANSCGRPAGPNTPLTPCAARKPTAALIANSNRSPGSPIGGKIDEQHLGHRRPGQHPGHQRVLRQRHQQVKRLSRFGNGETPHPGRRPRGVHQTPRIRGRPHPGRLDHHLLGPQSSSARAATGSVPRVTRPFRAPGADRTRPRFSSRHPPEPARAQGRPWASSRPAPTGRGTRPPPGRRPPTPPAPAGRAGCSTTATRIAVPDRRRAGPTVHPIRQPPLHGASPRARPAPGLPPASRSQGDIRCATEYVGGTVKVMHGTKRDVPVAGEFQRDDPAPAAGIGQDHQRVALTVVPDRGDLTLGGVEAG